jgi:predicted amidohydrolase YtcJ
MKNLPTKQIFVFVCTLALFSCHTKHRVKADLIVHHAVVYTADAKFSTVESFAVKDGRILATGKNDSILGAFEAPEMLDAKGKAIFPGFIDAHCHFYGYGRGLQEVDLVGTKSFDEIIQRLLEFRKAHPEKFKTGKEWIRGRGWDQNDWTEKEFPVRTKLDSLFPDTPVMLTRVDGHAELVNQVVLKLAGIAADTKTSGGMILTRPGKDGRIETTGVLVDNAMELAHHVVPPPSDAEMKTALLEAQNNCFEVGLTSVDDAGLEKKIVELMNTMQQSHELKMRIYAMLTDNPENLDYYLAKGPSKTERLNIRSFKFYADGALGSRGACLLKSYKDKPLQTGFLLNKPAYYSKMADIMRRKGFQMNTHCIGDSAVRLIEHEYAKQLSLQKAEGKSVDLRWRIEHFQVTTPQDMNDTFTMKHIIPSVQPTHATSDMYWAKERLGPERIHFAYAYQDLLKASGRLALGTDFPVEDISPFKTFYAAVARMDAKGFPAGGFQPENALKREETLRGMTIWAAFANFEEKEKGSLEPGKYADFILLQDDLMTCDLDKVLRNSVLATFVNGEKVFSRH